MGSIIELDDVNPISTVSKFSKTSSIVEMNVVESWWICGIYSSFL